MFTGRQARLEREARQNELTAIAQRSFLYPRRVERASEYLLTEARRGRDAYYGIHLFRQAGTRLASNAHPTVRALWLDEDGGRYPESGPEPTAIVWSSKSRRHLYWALPRPLSAEWVVSMNRRIAVWSGGDIGKAGLATVLRAPGTRNFKRHPQIDPVQLEITGTGPWAPEVMERAIPPLPDTEKRHRSEHYDGPPLDLLTDYIEPSGVEVLAEVPDGGGRKFAVVCPWVDEHSGSDRTGSFVGQFDSGAVWFCCRHEHCEGRTLRDFKEKAFPKGLVRLRVPRGGRRGEVAVRLG